MRVGQENIGNAGVGRVSVKSKGIWNSPTETYYFIGELKSFLQLNFKLKLNFYTQVLYLHHLSRPPLFSYSFPVPPQSLLNSWLFLYIFIHTHMYTHKYTCIECTYIYVHWCINTHTYVYISLAYWIHLMVVIFVCVFEIAAWIELPGMSGKDCSLKSAVISYLQTFDFLLRYFPSLLWTTVCFGAILFCVSWMISVWRFQKYIFEACFVQHRILDW